MIRSADSRYAHPCLLAVAILCLAIGAGMSATAQTDENWSPDFGLAGTDGEVICSVVWNGNLVVAGNFGVAGVSGVGGVALWDGSQWSAMGGGLEYSVGALAVWNGDLYAGGNFGESGGVTLNGLARWNGTSWEDVGGGVGGGVMALLATPSGLVVGGGFEGTTNLPGVNFLTRWNGSTWEALGSNLDGPVHGLAMHDDRVVAVGDFPAHVASFDGSSWIAVGGGLPDGPSETQLNAVISHDGQLYVGGAFDPEVDGATLLNIARWDGSQWQPLQGGLDGMVQSFAEWGGKLVIGGCFINPIFHVGTWDGWNFEALGDVFGVGWWGGDYVNTIATSKTHLYLGGVLTEIAQTATFGCNVFAWDGKAYSSLGAGNGLAGDVRTFGKWNGSVYAGGSFNRSYSTGNLNGVARWTGAGWESLDGGLQTSGYYYLRVNGLDTYAGDLVATGQFSTASGSLPVHNIARWDGSAWSPLGDGFASETFRSAVYQDELWVAGGYEELQNHTGGNLWKWSGVNWQSQADDVGVAFSLAVWDGKLILGGVFSSVAGVPANCVAQWNGISWSAMGAGLNAAVSNLVVFNNELYASGEFWMSGGNQVQGIARWTGSQWMPVGGAVSSNWAAHALGSGAGNLWMGGSWSHIEDDWYSNVARWDGSSWHALGSGTNGPVLGMFVDGSGVWAGGMFSAAGGKYSLRVARWSAPVSAVPTDPPVRAAFRMANPTPNPSTGAVSLAFSLPSAINGTVRIIDVRGRQVASLAQGSLEAGSHVLSWNGRADDGTPVASGVYWAILSAGDRRASARIVRLK
jgi:hypothetical protein